MSAVDVRPGLDFSELQRAVNDACSTIDCLREERRGLKARVTDLEAALARMVAEHEETESNTEGRYPTPDSGCIECTLGTVPNHLNTGLCSYHRSKELLA